MTVRLVKKGTTLIEVLVAIAILSVLVVTSVMAAPRYLNMAYDARRKDDLHSIKINLEIYFGYVEEYPKSLPDCGQPLMYKDQRVMVSMPCDPTTKKPYFYQVNREGYQAYRVYALLSDSKNISVVKAGCLGGCGPDCFYNYGVSSANTSLVKCSYVCAPGGGRLGSCERYENPTISLCPELYDLDTTCENECKVPVNKCKNASGKYAQNKF